MKTDIKPFFEINSAVLLFGLAGVLGKIIQLPPIIIVLGRVFFASIFLFLIIKFKKISLKTKNFKDLLFLLSLGILLSFHWFTFFASVKTSSVSLALITFSTFPIFLVFIEPMIFNIKTDFFNIFLAVLSFIGILIIANTGQDEKSVFYGTIFGVLSGFSFAFLTIFNKYYVKKYSSFSIAFYQDLSATIILIPFYFIIKPSVSITELSLLFILGVFCTGIAHTLFIDSMKKIKAQTAGVISCLEPVYGTIIAVIFLKERFGFNFLIGAIFVVGSAIVAIIKNIRTEEIV